jgi:periplasmic divalent cation tolerance protein
VEARLAACVSIVPGVNSVYLWRGAVESAAEHLLLVKTRADRYDALEAAIRARHPYELPEVLAVPVRGGLEAYLGWIDASTTPQP